MSGKQELARPQLSNLSKVVITTFSSTWRLQLLALEVAAQHVAGAQLAVAHRAALYLQSNAPFRQT